MMHPEFAARFQIKFFFAAFAYVYFLRSKGLLHGLAAGTNWVFRDESCHMNFAFDVVKQIRKEEPLLFDAELTRGAALDSIAASDEEADRLGELLGARVTFIAADGRVVGDSSEPLDGVMAMENHGQRPEVLAAKTSGLGRARRYSTTLRIDMLYVAVPVNHPSIGIVRVALPLTDVRQQLQTVLSATLAALGIALAGGAAIAWVLSARIGRRVRLIADIAGRYRRGDLTPPQLGFGDDELGTVAHALNESIQEIGRRLDEQARDRPRMEAILAGMVEGVIVVDAHGRGAPDAAARSRAAGPPVRGNDSPSGNRRARRRGAVRPHAGAAAAVAAARCRPDDPGARGAGGRDGQSRRGPGASRYHGPPPRRSNPPRFRR